jgi:hypothetical protein
MNSDNTGGLAVISPASLAHPSLLSTPAEMSCEILDVAVQDNYAILATGNLGVLGVDVSTPTAPHLVAHFITPHITTRVVVNGDLIYALDERSGIYVFQLP